MDIKVGMHVLFIPNPEVSHHEQLDPAIGTIVEIMQESQFPYRIIFDDDDDDWYNDNFNFVTSMINNYRELLDGSTV